MDAKTTAQDTAREVFQISQTTALARIDEILNHVEAAAKIENPDYGHIADMTRVVGLLNQIIAGLPKS